jgi:hypothetical protein
MPNKKIFIIAICLFFLFACTKRLETVKTVTVEIERPTLDLSLPDPISLETVEWNIIEDDGRKYIGVSFDDYKRLAVNLEKIQSFILSQRDIIKEQKDYYEYRR